MWSGLCYCGFGGNGRWDESDTRPRLSGETLYHPYFHLLQPLGLVAMEDGMKVILDPVFRERLCIIPISIYYNHSASLSPIIHPLLPHSVDQTTSRSSDSLYSYDPLPRPAISSSASIFRRHSSPLAAATSFLLHPPLIHSLLFTLYTRSARSTLINSSSPA
jgi:hypothetical protein